MEQISWVVDWDLEQEPFKNSIREMIRKAEKGHKVLALPITLESGRDLINSLALLLPQVNCDKCQSACCTTSMGNRPIEVAPWELERIRARRGDKYFTKKNGMYYLPVPCPFLKNIPHNRCSIYELRPSICVLYPWQVGGSISRIDGRSEATTLALASDCPEGRRICQAVFMTYWKLRKVYLEEAKE